MDRWEKESRKRRRYSANEHWRAAPGFGGFYEVSSFGRVTGLGRWARSKRFLAPAVHTGGYLFLMLCGGKRIDREQWFVHRLVACTFLGNLDKSAEVNHVDCNKKNNDVSNLEVTTRYGNYLHAVAHGLNRQAAQGVNHRAAKLSEVEVLLIRERGVRESSTTLGREYGVHPATIRKIVNRRIWGHLP